MNEEENAFKLLMKIVLGEVDIYTETDIPSGNLRIDYLIVKPRSLALKNGFPSFIGKKVIIGEFKSFRDGIKPFTITTLLVKALLTFDTVLRKKKPSKEKALPSIISQALEIDDYAILLILGGKNRLKHIEKYYKFSQEGVRKHAPGVYSLNIDSPVIMDFYVVVLEEIPLTKDTIPLKLFASPYWRERAIQEVISIGDEFIYTLCLYLFEEEVSKVSQLIKKKINPTQESIKKATETLGIEKVIEAVGIEKVIETVGIEKVIETVGIEKVIETVGVQSFSQLLLNQILKGKLEENDENALRELYEILRKRFETKR